MIQPTMYDTQYNYVCFYNLSNKLLLLLLLYDFFFIFLMTRTRFMYFIKLVVDKILHVYYSKDVPIKSNKYDRI